MQHQPTCTHQGVSRTEERPDLVLHNVVTAPDDFKSLFARFGMDGKRAVSQAKAARLVDHVHNAAGVQKSQTAKVRRDSHGAPRF